MIFVCVKAGQYMILENDVVVANISKRWVYPRTNTEYIKGQRVGGQGLWSAGYKVIWVDADTDDEVIKNLPDLADKYKFKNFPAYQHLLKRK